MDSDYRIQSGTNSAGVTRTWTFYDFVNFNQQKGERIMKKWTLVIACLAIAVALSFGPLPNHAGAADFIKWGVLIDLSGPTSDWG